MVAIKRKTAYDKTYEAAQRLLYRLRRQIEDMPSPGKVDVDYRTHTNDLRNINVFMQKALSFASLCVKTPVRKKPVDKEETEA